MRQFQQAIARENNQMLHRLVDISMGNKINKIDTRKQSASHLGINDIRKQNEDSTFQYGNRKSSNVPFSVINKNSNSVVSSIKSTIVRKDRNTGLNLNGDLMVGHLEFDNHDEISQNGTVKDVRGGFDDLYEDNLENGHFFNLKSDESQNQIDFNHKPFLEAKEQVTKELKTT